jgi:hypothetical protein
MFSSKKKNTYKEKVVFSERSEESSRIKSKYPDRIPCIVELSKDFDNLVLDNLEVSLVDRFGNVFSGNRLNYSFTLEFETD